jgi:hypothetical protein
MNRRDEVQDLIIQLQDLQLQQTELLIRLQRARHNETRTTAGHDNNTDGDNTRTRAPQEQIDEPDQVPIEDTTRPFAVGDKVRIKNPNRFQSNQGVITKVNANRINVRTPSGKNILRAHKNIERSND